MFAVSCAAWDPDFQSLGIFHVAGHVGAVGDDAEERGCATLHLKDEFPAWSVDGVFLISPSSKNFEFVLSYRFGDALCDQLAAVCGVGICWCY